MTGISTSTATKAPKLKGIPPFCPKCDAEGSPFVLSARAIEQQFRGETFRVTAPFYACRSCGFEILGEAQFEQLALLTHAAYRVKHNLLSPSQIRAARKSRGMTQTQFAQFLGVSVASVKR